jgi:cytochrome b561
VRSPRSTNADTAAAAGALLLLLLLLELPTFAALAKSNRRGRHLPRVNFQSTWTAQTSTTFDQRPGTLLSVSTLLLLLLLLLL